MGNDPNEGATVPSGGAGVPGMINRVLAGRYEVLETLGEGPLLAAYRARDRSLNRIVTIKTLRPSYAGRADVVAALKEGLSQTLSLTHAAVTRTYDVGTDPETGVLYLAEEYVRGIDLRERIRRAAPFQLTAAVETAIAVAEGLEVAHARGIAHGDVRPQNVLIGPDGQIKLTGFGVAAAQRLVLSEDPALLRRLIAYLAPDAEGADGDAATPSPSADRYALGCILYEMLTGEAPFTGDTNVQVALRHAQEAAPSPRRVNTGVPPALDGIVRKALGKTPETRYASDEDLLRDLRAVRDALRYGKSLSWSPLDATAATAADATIVGGARPGVSAAPAPADATIPAVGMTPPSRPAVAEPATAVMPTTAPAGGGGWRSTAAAPAVAAAAAPHQEDEYELTTPAGSGGNRWLTSLNLFLILVVIASAAGLFYMIGNFLKPSDEVVVPNLVGKTLTDAKTMAAESKFGLSIVDKQYRDTEPADVIYQMGVAPGRRIKEGKAIPVWVSLGPRMVEIPDVRQLVFDKARRVIESKGLRLGEYKAEYDPLLPKGTVIKQVPPPGENRPRSTRVDLTLSKGEEPLPTPTPDTEETPAPPVDAGLPATPAPDATSGAEAGADGKTRYFDIKYPTNNDGDQHRIRIDVLDDNGPRTVFDEVKKSGEKVVYRVEAVGKQVTIKVYDNDELRSELTK